MKPIALKGLLTLVAVPLEVGILLVIIGESLRWDAPSATEFSYLYLVLFLLVPLLTVIWVRRSGLGRRLLAWFIGSAFVIAALIGVYATKWPHFLISKNEAWALIAGAILIVGIPILGFVLTWLIVRHPRAPSS